MCAACASPAMTRSQVLLDREGRPLAPAVLFRDRRAMDDAAGGRGALSDRQPGRCDHRVPSARAHRVVRAPAAKSVRSNQRCPRTEGLPQLSAHRAKSPPTASPIRATTTCVQREHPLPDWLERCLRLLELPRLAPWQMLGRVTRQRSPWRPPCRNSRVRRRDGRMGHGGGLGSGHRRSGVRYRGHVGGRWALHVRHARSCRASYRLIWGERCRQIGGPTQAGADCASWCACDLARSRPARHGRGARGPDHARDAICRCSYPISQASGRRSGAPMSVARSRAWHVATARTICSGRCWKAWRCRCATSSCARSTDRRTRMREVRVAGGGAQSNAWCQIKADVDPGAHDSNVAARDRPHRRGDGRRGRPRLARSLAAAAIAMCPGRAHLRAANGPAPSLYAERAERHGRARQHAIAEADATMSSVVCPRNPRESVEDEQGLRDATGFIATYGTAISAAILFSDFRRRRAELPQSDQPAQRAEAGELPRDPRARLRHGAHHERARPLVRECLQLRRGRRRRSYPPRAAARACGRRRARRRASRRVRSTASSSRASRFPR